MILSTLLAWLGIAKEIGLVILIFLAIKYLYKKIEEEKK